MSITLIKSKNINASTAAVVDSARAQSIKNESTVLVLVPDRFTLQCEKMLMQGSRCLLGVRVVTFSMLFNIVNEEISLKNDPRNSLSQKPILDKTKAVLFMWRAIQQVRPELVWFAPSVKHYGFAEKMFNTVNQLASSMADFNKLESNARNEITRKKMHDIALIYKAYKQQIADYTDSLGMLGFLLDNIKQSEVIKNSHVYVTGFDYLSVQRGAVVRELIRRASCFTAGARVGSEFEILLSDICINETLAADFINLPDNNFFKHAALQQCPNTREEAYEVTNHICELVQGGARYKDMVVAINDFENVIKIWNEVFAQSGIPANVDVGISLLDHPLTVYLKNLFLFPRPESVVTVLKSPYSGIRHNEEFNAENHYLKYNRLPAEVSFPQSSALQKCKTYESICTVLESILEETAFLRKESNLDPEEKIMEDTARTKITEILAALKNILKNQKTTLAEYNEVFCTLASAAKISSVPIFADRVMLANAKDYEPAFVPYLFVTGSAAGTFPIEQDDTDIITEFDIKHMDSRIEPSPSLQNTRNRNHAMAILSSARERLHVTYSVSSPLNEESRASALVENFASYSREAHFSSRAYAEKKLLEAWGSGEVFENPTHWNSVRHALGTNFKIPALDKPVENLIDASALFFPETRAHVTQFENFYKCPYLHYLQNGLKIKPREVYQGAANFWGTLIHKYVEIFLKTVIEKQTPNPDAIMKSVLEMKEYAGFAQDTRNAPVIAFLKKEARRIAKLLLATGKYSPAFVEKRINAPIGNVTVTGVIDRIDTMTENGRQHAVIIDYKTGADARFRLADVQNGTRLQLPLYMDFLQKEYIVDGAFYFSLRAGFNKAGFQSGISVETMTREELDSIIGLGKSMAENAAAQILDGAVHPKPCSINVCRYCMASAACRFKEAAR